jgi:hypothetical protein
MRQRCSLLSLRIEVRGREPPAERFIEFWPLLVDRGVPRRVAIASLDDCGLPEHAFEPSGVTLEGRLCRLERLDPARHAASLYEAARADVKGSNWTYLPYGPFDSLESYRAWMDQTCRGTDPLFYAIVEAFALGYRRYEWKCNALNSASRKAAQRLGLSDGAER